MPDWLKALFPVRSWRMVLLPIGLTILSVLLAGVTVSCQGQSQHLAASQYFSQYGTMAFLTSFLLPFRIELVSQGTAIAIQSNIFLGLIAILAGMLVAIRLTKTAEEGLWMTGPYWILTLIAVLCWMLSGKGSVKLFPFLFFTLATPPLLGLIAKYIAFYGSNRGWFQLEDVSSSYQVAVGQALSQAKPLGQAVGSRIQQAVRSTQAPTAGAQPGAPTAPPPASRPTLPPAQPPAPSVPQPPAPQQVQAVAPPPLPVQPQPVPAPPSPPLQAAPPPATPPAPGPEAALPEDVSPEAVPQYPVRVSYAAVCPFCGSPKIRHQQPGICGVCHRNLGVMMERPGDPRCGACDGTLVNGAYFCHHCGGLLRDVGAS